VGKEGEGEGRRGGVEREGRGVSGLEGGFFYLANVTL